MVNGNPATLNYAENFTGNAALSSGQTVRRLRALMEAITRSPRPCKFLQKDQAALL